MVALEVTHDDHYAEGERCLLFLCAACMESKEIAHSDHRPERHAIQRRASGRARESSQEANKAALRCRSRAQSLADLGVDPSRCSNVRTR